MKGKAMLWLLGTPLALVVAIFLYWQLRYPTHTYRFKLMVEVETPEGIKHGSSVYEVKARNVPNIFPQGASREWAVQGEAVAVDLPNGQTLFALMRTGALHGDMAGLSMSALHPSFNEDGGDIVGAAKALSLRLADEEPTLVSPTRTYSRYESGELVENTVNNYPTLITFKDLNDPASIVEVNPENPVAHIGEGYSINRITVQITDQDVTNTGILERLPQGPLTKEQTYTGEDAPELDLYFGKVQNLRVGMSLFSQGLNE